MVVICSGFAYAVAIPDGSTHPVCVGFSFISTVMALARTVRLGIPSVLTTM